MSVRIVLEKVPRYTVDFNDETSTAIARLVVDDNPNKITIKICSDGTYIVRRWTETRLRQNYRVESEGALDRRVEIMLDMAQDTWCNNGYFIAVVKVVYGDECDDDGFPTMLSGKTELRKYTLTKEYILRWLEVVLKLGRY